MFPKLSASALLFVLPILNCVSSVGAWTTVAPVQKLFPKSTHEILVVFIPYKNTPPALTSDQAATLTNSIFAPTGYGVGTRFSEYSSGAVTLTGLASSGDPYVSFKYLDQGVDTCDRNTIVSAVKAAIAPANPTRLVIVQNTHTSTCSGYADTTSDATVAWIVDALNPIAMFHEFGHRLSFGHAVSSLCYSKGSQVMMSSNCTSINGDKFEAMNFAVYGYPWLKSDGVTNAATGIKGVFEYSSYNRLSSTWPMLKEANVLDATGNGTYTIYSSETPSIGTKPALLRIPLNPPIKIQNDLVSTGVTYQTHYYVDLTQRFPEDFAKTPHNYLVVRSAPDHRAKRSRVTRFMKALSMDDPDYNASFYDGYRQIRITASSITSTSATFTVTFPKGYTLPSNVNQCYYSGAINTKYAITVNNQNVCRALSRDNLPCTGNFNGTHCLIPYSGSGHPVAAPDVEYLHCLNTPKWISTAQSTMENAFDIWNEGDMNVCKITINGAIYQGRGRFGECCVYYNDSEKCAYDDPTVVYLSWIS
ncbi:hypothetical protein GGI15_002463 [Coemansia interrupta]|uniref:Peptidase M11 gametolysin domain-containing protein n=1 Tax=Coemansia interrupta TaxID=1126814 RepID=A0A9W8HGX1_9FUNG|nr:hypothetical protein GGI15_002463 [Coemansia interrupta]